MKLARASDKVLLAALLALAGLYLWWFGSQASPWAALAVFALPPSVLAGALLRGHRRAGFWAAVFALAWFSHGVMVAYTRPMERLFAIVEVALAVIVVFAASLPGLRARFRPRPRRSD